MTLVRLGQRMRIVAGAELGRRSPMHESTLQRMYHRLNMVFPGSAVLASGVQIWHGTDRKSTRLNSSHLVISYAVFCLKKKMHLILWQVPYEAGIDLCTVVSRSIELPYHRLCRQTKANA